MVKPATRRKVAAVSALVPLAASVALLSSCKPNQPPATSPGTTPAIWTGSPSPSEAQQKGGAAGAGEPGQPAHPTDRAWRREGGDGQIRVRRRLRDDHPRDDGTGRAGAGIPWRTHPLGGQVGGQLGCPTPGRA